MTQVNVVLKGQNFLTQGEIESRISQSLVPAVHVNKIRHPCYNISDINSIILDIYKFNKVESVKLY